jgi:hypothetical protein
VVQSTRYIRISQGRGVVRWVGDFAYDLDSDGGRVGDQVRRALTHPDPPRITGVAAWLAAGL